MTRSSERYPTENNCMEIPILGKEYLLLSNNAQQHAPNVEK